MKSNFLFISSSIAIFLLISSCKKVGYTLKPLSIAENYDTTNYQSNIKEFVPYTQSFDELVVELKKGRTNGVKLDGDKLGKFLTNYNGVTIYTDINLYNVEFLMDFENGWLKKASIASGNALNPDSSNGLGGTYGGYLFTEKGHEPEQMAEKNLFGSYLSKMAIQLLILNEPTLKTLDQAMFFIGLTPQFKNSGATKHGVYADKYMANYIARRDKNDGTGYYSQIKYNFLKLQAALKAGSEYNKERDEARNAIKDILEKATFATVINYCHASIANMSQTEMTEAQKAATLHAMAECAGFATGWINMSRKTMSFEKSLQILDLLQSKPDALGKPLLYISDRVNQVSKINQIITLVQTELNFTNTEIEDFKKNWVNEQNR
jgi:hypothetical protein